MPALPASRSAISSQVSMPYSSAFFGNLAIERWPCWSMTDALGRAPTKRGTGREDALKVFVRFLVPENSLGHLKQAAKLDQGRDACSGSALCLGREAFAVRAPIAGVE